MKKLDLIDRVAEASGQSKAIVRAVLEAVVSVALSAVRAGDDVRLFGLGKLYVSHRAEKPARNIWTGDMVIVPPRRVVLFRASDALNASANEA